MSAFYDRLFRLINEDKENSIRRCLVLATPSFQVAEDRSSWKWWLIVSVIRMLGGDAYADIVGIGKVVSALPVDEIEWTLFRYVSNCRWRGELLADVFAECLYSPMATTSPFELL